MSFNTTTATSDMSMQLLRSEQDWKDDLIVVCTWLTLTLYALVANILIVVGVSSSVVMRNSTSYWLIISLCVCDIGMVIVSLAHLIPSTAFHNAFCEIDSLRNLLMIFIYDIFWYTEVVHFGVMAMNRYTSIVHPTHYTTWFSTRRTAYIVVFCYLLGLAVSVPTLLPCCHTLWDPYNYISIYTPPDTWYKYIDLGINAISLAVMVISYATIFSKVRRINRRFQQHGVLRKSSYKQCSKKELALFMQFLATSVFYLLTWTTWQWLPHISASKWIYFVMTSLFFINNSINPTIYLVFNTSLRRRICGLLWRKQDFWTSSAQKITLKPLSLNPLAKSKAR
ncbi:hypothetical protein Y032_0005g2735 [Ancylostoma ceylanicum]|uniref:G-protein coupled receptors family 1 profile domain-containing protein n=1 Tax=Ancylostoma ceylanicum TaxID=53326 RepID=A0A016VUA0_9BILA|nr:hypothetical protein Y032_0005g2735 [Ancylostoma ceylanicum]